MYDDLVTYELAVKLKEKGFDIPFYFYYRTDDKYLHHAMVTKPLVYCDKIDDEVVCAPTISQVLKWLRKEKIHIVIDFDNNMCWYFQIALYSTTNYEKESEHKYNSYEQTALEGIKYVLNNLI